MLGDAPLYLFSALPQLPQVNSQQRLKITLLCLTHLGFGVISLNTLAEESSSALQPLTRNKAFTQGIGVTLFDDWFSKDPRFVSDLFKDGNFMSFIQIQNKFQVSRNHFFGFLQVRHFVKSYLKLPNDKPMLSPIESFLLNLNFNAFNDKKCLSLFYGK